MSVSKISMTATATVLGLGFILSAPLDGQEIRGQLKVGIHQVKLEKGKLYEVKLITTSNVRPEIDLKGANLIRILAKDPADDQLYFLPNRTDEYPFYITYASFGQSFPEKDTIDYKLKFNASELNAKPLLTAEDKLTDKDDLYRQQKKYYKPYKVKLNAGTIYVIDLVKDGIRDPFLYLENARGEIVATDDDNGGDLNARIVFAPRDDGEFTIIATTLDKDTGGFVLTVRGSK